MTKPISMPSSPTCPAEFTDDGYARRWQAEKYQNRWEGRGFKFETPRGERVRSKSEWMIASMLDASGVPYRYEETVGLHELYGGAFHPDFTVLNKRTRKEYYWEHFGRMDDPETADDLRVEEPSVRHCSGEEDY